MPFAGALSLLYYIARFVHAMPRHFHAAPAYLMRHISSHACFRECARCSSRAYRLLLTDFQLSITTTLLFAAPQQSVSMVQRCERVR